MINWIIKFIVVCIIIAITAFLTPGFTISSVWALIFAAIVIILLDYVFSKVFNLQDSKVGRFKKAFIGFVLMGIIIYLTQYLVRGFNVSLISAFIAALVYGILDAIIPGETRAT